MPAVLSKNRRAYTDDDLKKAIRAVRLSLMSYGAAEREFNVPKSTLYKKINITGVDYLVPPGSKPVLGQDVENEIYVYCRNMSRCGLPLRKRDLLDLVQRMIKKDKIKNPFTFDRPGKKWFKGFMNRHPDLKMKKPEHHSVGRAAVTKEMVEAWFRRLHQYLKDIRQDHILKDPKRIWNADETNFPFTFLRGKYICESAIPAQRLATCNEKENITVLVNYNAAGDWAPILPVYKGGKNKLSEKIELSIPPGVIAGISKTGWMQSETFLAYLKKFKAHCLHEGLLDETDDTKKVLLYVDGHKSHLSLEASIFSEENGIILYALYPNATHVLQPADVGVMAPLKTMWLNLINENHIAGLGKVAYGNVAPLLKKAFDSLSKVTMMNSFKATGLFPFDSAAVKYEHLLSERIKSIQTRPEKGEHSLLFFDDNNLQGSNIQGFYEFESSLGVYFLEKFKNSEGGPWKGAKQITGLFEFWKQWKNRVHETLVENDAIAGLAATFSENERQNGVEMLVDPVNGFLIPVENEEDSSSFEVGEAFDLETNNVEGHSMEGVESNHPETHGLLENISPSTIDDEDVPNIPFLNATVGAVVDEAAQQAVQDVIDEANAAVAQQAVQDLIEEASNAEVAQAIPDVTENEAGSSGSSTRKRKNTQSGDQSSAKRLSVATLRSELRVPLAEKKTNNTRRKRRLNYAVSSPDYRQENFNKKRKYTVDQENTVLAPDDWQCVYCGKLFSNEKGNSNWLSCDTCNDHFHYRCVGASHKKNTGLNVLIKSKQFQFNCEECTLGIN